MDSSMVAGMIRRTISSIEKDNYNNDLGRLLPFDSSAKNIQQLRLYYIRIHDIKDKLKVQIDFGQHIKFTFSEGKRLYGKDNFGPVLYTLDLRLILANNGHLYVDHREQFKYVGDYHLTCSYISVIGKHFKHEGKRYHSLYDCIDNNHLFLFDIRFHSCCGFHLPGEDTGIFTDLCLFTCFLLRDQTYGLFDTIKKQFRITLSKYDYTFNRHEFHNFFDNCIKYLNTNTSIDFHNDLVTIKILIEMIGLLTPIRKESFDRNCSSANEFTNQIMSYVRTDFKRLVNGSEWFLLKNGLALLSSLEILYDPLGNPNDNKLAFLYQISDENQRQDIADELLQQLFILEQPIILQNSNWTDLFTMVHPQKIQINHLNLASTFDTFILCITKISTVLQDHQFEQQITDCFENRVLYNHFQIDLTSISYLLEFLDQELSDNNPVTKHFLSTVQSAIRNSCALKQKIKDYFDKLEVTLENMEEIWIIICAIEKFSIFENINKYEYLEKSLRVTH